YSWDAVTNSWALAATGIMSIIVQGGLVGPVVKALGERRSMIVGLTCGITAFLIYAVGPTDVSIWIAIPIGALWGFYTPAAQTLWRQSVPANHQGQLQGALGSMMGIAMIIAPLLYPQVFAAAIDFNTAHPLPSVPLLGAPFFVAAFLLMCALAIIWRAT